MGDRAVCARTDWRVDWPRPCCGVAARPVCDSRRAGAWAPAPALPAHLAPSWVRTSQAGTQRLAEGQARCHLRCLAVWRSLPLTGVDQPLPPAVCARPLGGSTWGPGRRCPPWVPQALCGEWQLPRGAWLVAARSVLAVLQLLLALDVALALGRGPPWGKGTGAHGVWVPAWAGSPQALSSAGVSRRCSQMGVSCGGPSWGTPWGQGVRGPGLGAPHCLAPLRPLVPLSSSVPLPRFKLFSFARTLQGPGMHGFPTSEVMCGSHVPWERASASSFPLSLVTGASGSPPRPPCCTPRHRPWRPVETRRLLSAPFSHGVVAAARPPCPGPRLSLSRPLPCLCLCLGGRGRLCGCLSLAPQAAGGPWAGSSAGPSPALLPRLHPGLRRADHVRGVRAASRRVRALLLCGGLGVSCAQAPHFSPARTPAAPGAGPGGLQQRVALETA